MKKYKVLGDLGNVIQALDEIDQDKLLKTGVNEILNIHMKILKNQQRELKNLTKELKKEVKSPNKKRDHWVRPSVIKILRRQQKEFLNLTEELIVVRAKEKSGDEKRLPLTYTCCDSNKKCVETCQRFPLSRG